MPVAEFNSLASRADSSSLTHISTQLMSLFALWGFCLASNDYNYETATTHGLQPPTQPTPLICLMSTRMPSPPTEITPTQIEMKSCTDGSRVDCLIKVHQKALGAKKTDSLPASDPGKTPGYYECQILSLLAPLACRLVVIWRSDLSLSMCRRVTCSMQSLNVCSSSPL